jgi:hypothetical protein
MTRTRLVAIVAGVLAVVGLTAGCTKEATDVNKNLSTDADNFKIARTVTFVNGITDKVILQIEGFCSVDPGDGNRMTVTCKDDQGKYIRHALGKADNVFWFYEQIQAQNVSTSHYRFVIRPESLVPEVVVRNP